MATCNDFLTTYVGNTGQSEVPRAFHTFAGLSLLAASVADRVWLIRDNSGTRIYPNLYVFLIGASGSGKERAITNAARFAEGLPSVGLFTSTGITKQYLIDHLSRPLNGGQEDYRNVLYLVTEELGMSVPSKELGGDLIKFMTGHYIPSGLTLYEGTRMHGQKALKNVLLNWLAGTTDEWLTQAIEKYAVMGGFFARVLPIRGQRIRGVRYPNIVYPPNYEDVKRHLQARVEMYATVSVQFVKSKDAALFYDAWYVNEEERPDPTDTMMVPAFHRTDEMVHRLAILLKLSSMEDIPGYFTTLEIERPFFEQAVATWQAILQDVPETVRRAASTPDSADAEVLADIIQRVKSIDHSTLLRRARHHGLNASRVKQALDTLEQSREIKLDVEDVGRGKTKRVYRWGNLG